MRIVIADDELLARQRLVRLVEAMEEHELVAVCASATELLEALAEEAVDLALLDVDMPGTSGIAAAKELGEQGVAVVFVTAHPEHALDAFEVGALDYVVKPVEAERLAKALQRARARAPVPVSGSGPLALPGGRGIRILHPDEVTHAEIVNKGVVVHTHSGPVHSEWSLAELERRLPAERFVRVHRSTLVAVAAVEWVEEGALRLRGGERVIVSRGARRMLRRRLGI